MENNENKSAPASAAGGIDIKQKIVDAASVLFAEKTYDGASVRDIAAQSGVNIAMISYYFGGKEGLYLECIAQFAQGRSDMIQKVLTPVKTQEEFKVRLKLFFENMMALYSSDKHLVRIIMREAQMERGIEFHKKVMFHMHPIFLKVQLYYETAIANGILKSTTDAHFLASITMAMLSHPCMMEKAIENSTGQDINSSDFQTQYIRQVCETIFSGVLT